MRRQHQNVEQKNIFSSEQDPEHLIRVQHRLRPWLAGVANAFIQYSFYVNVSGLTFARQPLDGGATTSAATALSISLVAAAKSKAATAPFSTQS